MSGGNEKNTYFFSLSNLQQEGIIRESRYDRTNIRFNYNAKLNDWMDLSNKVAYNELTYAPIEYNTLNDFSWDLTKGLGVPELKLSLLLVLSESDTSGDTVINGSYYSDSDRNMRTKNVTIIKATMTTPAITNGNKIGPIPSKFVNSVPASSMSLMR